LALLWLCFGFALALALLWICFGFTLAFKSSHYQKLIFQVLTFLGGQ
jgi:ammonia channel protein AmtB